MMLVNRSSESVGRQMLTLGSLSLPNDGVRLSVGNFVVSLLLLHSETSGSPQVRQ